MDKGKLLGVNRDLFSLVVGDNSGITPENLAKRLMDRALLILDSADEALAAVHLEQAIYSIKATSCPPLPHPLKGVT